MNAGDYALAKDYIREVQSITSASNIRARRKLDELMRVVEEKEAQEDP